MSTDRLRVSAYLLAADPSWLEESVGSYYALVDRIVISYDDTGTSWTGTAMPVEECLQRLKSMDVDAKMTFAPGRHFRPGKHPLENETYQRRIALTEASKDADWVIQLDTDEVLADPSEFVRCIREAERLGFSGLEYPARILYQHLRDQLYLEQCRRFWSVAAHYPGPMALRAGSALTLARQGDATLYRVDFRKTNTDPAHPGNTPVHRIIGQAQAIMHYSMVRGDEYMRAKARGNGHSTDFDWGPVISTWQDRRDHPFRAVVGTPFRHGEGRRFLRFARIAGAPDRVARQLNGLRS